MEKGNRSALMHAQQMYKSLRRFKPHTAKLLRDYVKVFLGVSVPDRVLCHGHASPMDYLWHAYSCDLHEVRHDPRPPSGDLPLAGGELNIRINGDCIVWANRGGGKTLIAAIATLMEGLFKPGCQTRILAGSLDQAGRMYEYLCRFVEHGYEDLLDGPILKQSCRFKNAAAVQVLPQSARAVRGRHVHKLRCDEIEMFDEDVFNAAKFMTQSTDDYRAAMEMVSTMHRPYGLMQKLIDTAPDSGIDVFRWCMWEVIERCSEDRSCSRCPLSSDCRGKARRANGYLKIDDCISQMRRSSRVGFESEMLCLRPSLENAVFDEFEPSVHVAPTAYDSTLPLYRAIDFGFVNPFVCLWIQVDHEGTVRIIDEYVKRRMRIAEHAAELKARTPCDESQVTATFCDPAGAGRNGVTGSSEICELKEKGISVRYCRSAILEGIEKIRAALRAGDGQSRLVIDPDCRHMIEAMRCYHYPDSRASVLSELPKKDGLYDHLIDALRYFFVNCLKDRKALCVKY